MDSKEFKRLSEKERGIRKINCRMHMNDHALLLKLLSDDKMTFQTFAEACIQAYLRADPAIMKVIKDWRTLNDIPKEHLDRYTLSHRERADVMKELELIQKEHEKKIS